MLQDIFTSLLNYTYPALIVTLVVLPAWLFIREKGWQQRLIELWETNKWLIAFIFCLSFIVVATVISRPTTNPYHAVFKHFGPGDTKWNNEIIENVLLFIPLTFLYAKAFPGKRLLKGTILLSVWLTLFIELSQLIFWLGEFQFSDLFHNFVGGMIGFGVWYAAEQIRKKKSSRQ